MTSFPFARLLSMPAFEGLRVIRIYLEQYQDFDIDDIVLMIRRVEADSRSYDMEAAIELHIHVPPISPFSGIQFYRECLSTMLLKEFPAWIKLVKLGRGRFIKRLRDKESRDICSLFSQAKLLGEPPDDAEIEWWDRLQARVRNIGDEEKMERARISEKLSLDREAELLKKLGISGRPIWIAIEDNTVGYDILSYRSGTHGLINRLIEVKSTIASPMRFYLTRNEWETALKFGNAFVFHIWNLQADPPVLFEKTVEQIAPHVPKDNEKGKWSNAEIPVGV